MPGPAAPSGRASGFEPRPMSRTGWSAAASINKNSAALAIDGSIDTRWESGPQKIGISFTLDLGERKLVRGISLRLGKSHTDYPRGYFMEVSPDGAKWERIAAEEKTVIPILAYMKSKDLAVSAFFDRKDIRFFRITNTGNDPVYYWSIHEIEVYQ